MGEKYNSNGMFGWISEYIEEHPEQFNDYQQTGDPRMHREYRRYDELSNVYTMAYKYQQETDEDRTRRLRNFTKFVNDHFDESTKETYTRAEVASLLRELESLLL